MFSLHSALVVAGLEFTDAITVIGKAYMAGFSCKLLSAPEEEFVRNALQTGLLRYDDIPLRPINRDGMTGRRKEFQKV